MNVADLLPHVYPSLSVRDLPHWVAAMIDEPCLVGRDDRGMFVLAQDPLRLVWHAALDPRLGGFVPGFVYVANGEHRVPLVCRSRLVWFVTTLGDGLAVLACPEDQMRQWLRGARQVSSPTPWGTFEGL